MAAVCIIELLLLLSCNELSAPICKIWNSKKKLIHVCHLQRLKFSFFQYEIYLHFKSYLIYFIYSSNFNMKNDFSERCFIFLCSLKKKWYKMIERRPNFPIPTAAVDVIYCRLGMIIALLRMLARTIISERSWMSCVPLRIFVRMLLLFRL